MRYSTCKTDLAQAARPFTHVSARSHEPRLFKKEETNLDLVSQHSVTLATLATLATLGRDGYRYARSCLAAILAVACGSARRTEAEPSRCASPITASILHRGMTRTIIVSNKADHFGVGEAAQLSSPLSSAKRGAYVQCAQGPFASYYI